MRVNKLVIYANAGALAVNAVIVWLTVVKSFPAALGIVLIVGFFAAAVWASCAVNGKLPRKAPKYDFYSAPTEEVERI